MRELRLIGVGLILLLGSGLPLLAQDNPTDRAAVPFSDPGKPGFLKVGVHRGSITITGYSGPEVIVEARARTREVKKTRENDKARGMKLIQIASTGLTVTEENNEMRIGVASLQQWVDLTIQVPVDISLKVSAFNGGDVEITGVNGAMEVNNHNGGIRMADISGSVVAQSFNGEVKVSLNRITPDSPMSFVTWNGDVDVTLPPDTRANLKLKSEQGDIFSDFEFQLISPPKKAEAGARDEEGRYKISFDKTINGAINGGGPEFSFRNFNGDIFIRKGK